MDILTEFGIAIHVHTDTPATPDGFSLRLATVMPALAGLAVAIALIAPRSTPFMLLLLCGPVVALAAVLGHRLGWRSAHPLSVVLILFSAYLALNATWAVDPLHGLARAVLCGLMTCLGVALVLSLRKLTHEAASQLHQALLIGVGIATAYLAIEIALGQPIRRLVISFIPVFQPSTKHMETSQGWVTQLQLYTLNRNLGLLNLMLWPLLLIARSWLPGASGRILGAALLALTALAVFNSEHETSMLAIVAGSLTLVGMTVAAPVMRPLIFAGWIAATLLVVPIAGLAHDAALHRADWLPQTARNRIVLWSVTAERMQESPVLGIGIDSTKPLDAQAAPRAPLQGGDAYAQRTGRHAHNIFMQTWYELGGVGAVFLLLAGVLALRTIFRLPKAPQAYASASFVSAMVIASFTWGMWQPWFMCAFGLWAALLTISLDAARRAAPST